MDSSVNMVKTDPTVAGRVGFFLICSMVVWTTLLYGTVHQPIIGIFYLAIAAIFASWAVDAFRSGYVRFDGSLFQIPILATAVYGLIQIIPYGTREETGGLGGIPATLSLDPFSTRQVALHFISLFVFLAAALVFIDTRRRLKAVVRLITIFGFVYAFYAILQVILSPDKIYGIYSSEAAVPFGSFVNRHNFAAFMEMSIMVPLGLILAGAIEKDRLLLYYTAIGVMGIALLLSGSRGGFVSIIAGAGFLFLIERGKNGKKRLFIRIAAAAVILGAIVAGAFLIGGESSLTRMAETTASKNFTTNRTQIWAVTLDVIKNNQPFGVGLGAFGIAYSKYDPFSGLERVEQAHNDYLEVLADAGVVGALIGLSFLFFLFRDGLRAARTRDKYLKGVAAGALSGCFAILVHSLFDFVLHTTALALMFLLLAALCGVCFRLGRAQRDGRETESLPAGVTPFTQNPSS